MQNILIKDIAEGFDLIVEDVDEDLELCKRLGIDESTLDNDSHSYAKTIVLGFYDDPEVKLASFFHEVGHKIIKYDPKNITKYEIEKRCWDAGLKLAEQHGIAFGKNVDKYIDRCLKTYEWTKFLGNGVDETEARRLAKET